MTTIEDLNVNVRVKTRARATISGVDQHPGQNRTSQRVHLKPPPKPHASKGESVMPLQADELPEQMEQAGADVDPYELAERVYEFMRQDIRVARDRSGGPL